VQDKGYAAIKTDPFWEEMGQYHTAHVNGVIFRRGEDRGAEIIAAIRDAVGPEVAILIDCHGHYSIQMEEFISHAAQGAPD
jgi:L-alanine-DL-glutamate epimerase-like enolase superfamily enzyme